MDIKTKIWNKIKYETVFTLKLIKAFLVLGVGLVVFLSVLYLFLSIIFAPIGFASVIIIVLIVHSIDNNIKYEKEMKEWMIKKQRRDAELEKAIERLLKTK